jgi:hypothetical protein
MRRRTTEHVRDREARGRPRGFQAFRGRAGGLGAAAGLFTLAVGGLWVTLGSSGPKHPDPRPGINGSQVVPASRYLGYERVAAVYAQAAEIPTVLDGLHCYCDCSGHSGHRSLLTCFESDHGAACDICLTEAAIAYRMTKDGRSLQEIRNAIDQLYGR